MPGTGAPFVVPCYRMLSGLRDTLAQGRVPAPALRTATDCERLCAFTTVTKLLCFLNELKRRIERGEACRLVEVKHKDDEGRFHVEFVIESIARERPRG